MLPIEVRFWAKVDEKSTEECWEWLGAKTSTGYGLFWPERRTTRTAHSIAYELTYDESIPSGYDVHHKCYNKSCVNPWHLEILSKADNTKDAFNTDTCKRGHLWTDDNTYIRPEGRRQCRTCRLMRQRGQT